MQLLQTQVRPIFVDELRSVFRDTWRTDGTVADVAA